MISVNLLECIKLTYLLVESAINKLPRTLQVAMESITKQTGWNILVIMGGLNPHLGGKIMTLVYCKSIISIECSILDLPFSSLYQGTTTDGKTFEGFLGSDCFEKRFMLTFDNFLHEFFDKWMNSWSANI
jgi:hypothetical protein